MKKTKPTQNEEFFYKNVLVEIEDLLNNMEELIEALIFDVENFLKIPETQEHLEAFLLHQSFLDLLKKNFLLIKKFLIRDAKNLAINLETLRWM